ncbi:MAG: hypothetical protein AAFR11_14355, partial [Pseudomonadota bacterium]
MESGAAADAAPRPTTEELLAQREAKLARYPADCRDWDVGPDGGARHRAAWGGDVRAMECLWLWDRDELSLGVQFGYMLLRATGEAPEGFKEVVRSNTHSDVAWQIKSAHENAEFLEPVAWSETERCYPLDEQALAVLALADRSRLMHTLCSEKNTPLHKWPWPLSLVFG